MAAQSKFPKKNENGDGSSLKKKSQLESDQLASLTLVEQTLLAECESTITKELSAFFNVGAALLKIRNGKLYRAEFKTFEEYCRMRWKFSRIHAHRLLTASEVLENALLPMGNILLPQNERQIRPLVGLKPETAQNVWKAAIERAPKEQVTGKLVAQEARKLKGLDHTEIARESWQDLVEPLLEEALKKVRLAHRAEVQELLYKARPCTDPKAQCSSSFYTDALRGSELAGIPRSAEAPQFRS